MFTTSPNVFCCAKMLYLYALVLFKISAADVVKVGNYPDISFAEEINNNFLQRRSTPHEVAAMVLSEVRGHCQKKNVLKRVHRGCF